MTAAFGVRGVGSVYYLAYAGSDFSTDLPWLWATVGFTVVLSVVVHGVAATPLMRMLDVRRDQPRERLRRRLDAVADGRGGVDSGCEVLQSLEHDSIVRGSGRPQKWRVRRLSLR